MPGLSGVPHLPFVVFAHIQQHDVRTGGQTRLGDRDGDFGDRRAGGVDNGEETG
jgi:hypothetical protein